MLLYLTIASCAIGVLAVILLIAFRPKPNNNLFALSTKLDDLFKKLDSIAVNMREDLKIAREENATIASQNRKELNETLINFRKEMHETLHQITNQNRLGIEAVNKTIDLRISELMEKVSQNNKETREALTIDLKEFSLVQRNKFDEWKMIQKEGSRNVVEQLDKVINKLEEKFNTINEQSKTDAHMMRQSLEASFKSFNQTFIQSTDRINELQREKFGMMEDKQNKLVDTTEKKLEEMRHTVDEKLQKTLNDRLGQSFELVRGQLESVQKGLGEMQNLAQDVGGLKKVLTNVKMRGGFGEVQLHMLLENILAPEQYEANVATKASSIDRVEFAVKFPNKEGDRDFVWLPIDAKFPKDAYEHLQNAYDGGDHTAIENAQKMLDGVIRKMAKDICEKYIDSPNTTSFGIMFLPFEGLFAEVVRKASLLEEIQRDCKVVITGPTTLAVILNSLQMGFRTLAIQKRSSEVWQVLSGVKKEFNQFGVLLDKAQKNIQTGLNQLDDVVGVRTRAIQRKLKGVEVLGDTSVEPQMLNGIEVDDLAEERED